MTAAGLVLAAGRGTRLGLGPKAFLELDGASLLQRAVAAISGCTDRVLVGVPAVELDRARAQLDGTIQIVAGGATRLRTLQILFERSTEDVLLVHDAARPLATASLARDVVQRVRQHPAVLPVFSPGLPVAEVREGAVVGSVQRERAHFVQTPQAYQRAPLSRALELARRQGWDHLTPWELCLRLDVPLATVPGEAGNIKVTTPLSWDVVRRALAPDHPFRADGLREAA